MDREQAQQCIVELWAVGRYFRFLLASDVTCTDKAFLGDVQCDIDIHRHQRFLLWVNTATGHIAT